MRTEGITYREILFQELERRKQANASYSLRAYARDLALSPSRLSEIFAQKNGLSLSNARRIASLISLEPSEYDLFCDSVESLHARSPLHRTEALKRMQRKQESPKEMRVKIDEFRLISDWYHFCILELLSLKAFVLNPKSAAEKLGLSVPIAKGAIDRLARLGWIRRVNGKWKSLEAFKTFTTAVPSKAARTFHTQMLRKAEKSIEFQFVRERHLHSLILAVRKSKIPEANRLLEEFCKTFNQEIGAPPGEAEEVYGLSLQFFRITKPSENTEK